MRPEGTSVPTNQRRTTALRWLKFNAVGALGIALQLFALAVFKTGLCLDYRVATALAVESAVLHNFFWHERFTWGDRGSLGWKQCLLRLLKFNFTTGMLSVVGNVVLMTFFIGIGHVNYLVANLLTIACCSIVNFFMSDRLVFSTTKGGNLD